MRRFQRGRGRLKSAVIPIPQLRGSARGAGRPQHLRHGHDRAGFPLEAVRLAGFDYATALGKRYPNVSVAILDGRLVATIAYDASVLAEETLAELAARTRGVSGAGDAVKGNAGDAGVLPC